MDKDKTKRYFNIPIPMLRDLYIDKKKFIIDAFEVGIYIYSQTLNGDEVEQFMDALSYFKIKWRDVPETIENAKSILAQIPGKYPFFGIEKKMLYDCYDYFNSDFEIICLGAFLGIKSIIGKSTYNKTNKAMIHARMFGFSTKKELPIQLTELQKKYQIPWHMDKVLLELQLNWNLKVYSNHSRGFYLSFDLSLDELAVISEKDKRKYRIQQLKTAKKQATEKAKLTAS